MHLFRYAVALVLLSVGFASAQTDKTFPTDDEINLVLTDTERAIQQYKPLIDQFEVQIVGKSATDATAKDRQIVEVLETAVQAFKGKPQAFNGPVGFAFFQWLDDAGRNALLCGSSASAQGSLEMMAGDIGRANSLLHLAKSCSDVATLIYTVSENAGALYQRYVAGMEQLADRATGTTKECIEVLKQNGVLPPKK